MIFATIFGVQVLVEKMPDVFKKYHKISKLDLYYDGLDMDLNLIVVDPLFKDANELVLNANHQNIVLFTSPKKIVKQFITELGIVQTGKTTLKVGKENYHPSSKTILKDFPSFKYSGPLLHGTNNILSYPLVHGHVQDSQDDYVGSQLELIRVYQTRNNTRLAIMPLELLEVKEAEVLITQTLQWTFKQKNVLDIKVKHFKVDENGNKISDQLLEYKIRDDIVVYTHLASRC